MEGQGPGLTFGEEEAHGERIGGALRAVLRVRALRARQSAALALKGPGRAAVGCCRRAHAGRLNLVQILQDRFKVVRADKLSLRQASQLIDELDAMPKGEDE